MNVLLCTSVQRVPRVALALSMKTIDRRGHYAVTGPTWWRVKPRMSPIVAMIVALPTSLPQAATIPEKAVILLEMRDRRSRV